MTTSRSGSARLVLNNGHQALRQWWHPVARTDDLRHGGVIGVRLLGDFYVIFRAGDQLGALVDRCPHRHTPLSRGSVVGQALQCAYHGWRFDIDGVCKAIPGLGAAPTNPRLAASRVHVCESGGHIWLAVDDPELPAPGLVHDHDAALEVRLPVIRARIGAAQMIENFLDVAHFPFVHASTFGASDLSQDRITALGGYHIESGPTSLTATGTHPCRCNSGPQCHQTFTYRYEVPFAASVSLEHSATGARSSSILVVQPECAESIRIFYSITFNATAADDVDVDEVLKFEQDIMREDLDTLESMRDTTLSLPATSQASTKLDRLTLAFRKVLADALEAGAR